MRCKRIGLMQHKFPFVSLLIEMDGNDLDVNVHPAKREVRFAKQPKFIRLCMKLFVSVYDSQRTNPAGIWGKDEPTSHNEQMKPGNVPEPFEVKRRQERYGHQNRTANIASHIAPTASEVRTAPVSSDTL